MIDVCLLGTGGMMPLPYRWLTSLLIRCNGRNILVDCGEGTQIAMKKKGWSPKPIDVICFTHFHADHISGLPGLLLTMGNCERTEPLYIIGPKGVEKVVNALRVVAPELPFEIAFHELTGKEEVISVPPYKIEAFKVNHNVTCYGYSFSIERKAKFNVEAAKKLDIPVNYWKVLQSGDNVEYMGKKYTPDMVMGEGRRGLKLTYCTDTRPVRIIAEKAKDNDLFICEGMYGETDKNENALSYKHMTMYEAAHLAKIAQPKSLWLTHYSPSLLKPEEYMDKVREIFPNSVAGKDGMSICLEYDEE